MNILSSLKSFFTGKSATKIAAPDQHPDFEQFVRDFSEFHGGAPFVVFLNENGALRQREIKFTPARPTIEEVNQARDEAVSDMIAKADEIIERLRANDDARQTTIVEENGVPTIKPARKRKPKGSGQ
ncbi:hypothetical protein [Brevundimonas sp. NPDC058933]|uniref:hypothetical protein n=1 Tax=Brevundimonas sp. NPDC058933 TaxID=3346673 RepID=UPI003BEF2605